MGRHRPVSAHHEIWWADPGPPVGRRPFLILHRDPIADAIENIVVAPLTTTDRGVYSHLHLGRADGLRGDSWVNFDSIQTVRRDWLVSRIAVLSPERSRQACATLAYALGCAPSPPYPPLRLLS